MPPDSREETGGRRCSKVETTFCCSSGKCSSMPPERICRQIERGGRRCSKVETTFSQFCCSPMPPDGKGKVGSVQRWRQLWDNSITTLLFAYAARWKGGGRRCSKVDTTEQTNFFPQQSEHGGDRQKLIWNKTSIGRGVIHFLDLQLIINPNFLTKFLTSDNNLSATPIFQLPETL